MRKFLFTFYLRCIVEIPPSFYPSADNDYLLSRIQACDELRTLLEFMVDRRLPYVKMLVQRVTEAFLAGDKDLRNVIETGFLEHVLERADLVPLFDPWKDNPAISAFYKAALQWGLAHPRPNGPHSTNR